MRTNDRHQLIMLLGHPVAHSLSPGMHNAHFRHLGINADYFAMECEKDRLYALLETLRNPLFAGANVTKPYKNLVVSMLDEVDEGAARIGAVNTIVSRNGKLIGYNTDGPGFVDDLRREIEPKKILILGVGGAGSAVGLFLSMAGSAVDYYDIKTERAIACADQSAQYAPSRALDTLDPSSYPLIVNATGLGMYGALEETPLAKDRMNPETFYIDLTYAPSKTRFLKDAESIGARIKNGLGMVIEQGALAFEHWTGLTADRAFMRAFMEEKYAMKEKRSRGKER